jgi:hypothetical protein
MDLRRSVFVFFVTLSLYECVFARPFEDDDDDDDDFGVANLCAACGQKEPEPSSVDFDKEGEWEIVNQGNSEDYIDGNTNVATAPFKCPLGQRPFIHKATGQKKCRVPVTFHKNVSML